MRNKKITYREIKAMQKADLKSKAIVTDVYRNFSTPFTWIFVKLGISPNIITISNYFLCIFGAILLSLGTYYSFLGGIFFFVLFRIFDDCDGEVARIQNKKSIEGLFFDIVGHYIYNFSIGIGLGFGLYRLYGNTAYIVLGLVFGFVFILQDGTRNAIKLLLHSMIIKDKTKYLKNKKALTGNLDSYFQKKLDYIMYKGKSWGKGSIFSKLFGIYPFQGLIYGDRLAIIILAGLAIIEYFLKAYTGTFPIFGLLINLVPFYILVVIISKIIWFICIICKMEKNRYITKVLKWYN